MIGPECVAQQKKLVATRIRNCGERSAWPAVMAGSPAAAITGPTSPCPSSAGGRRTRKATGIIRPAATAATISIVVRQSWWVISQAASGDMVIGAIPMPAETSDTARLLWVSNQPVTQAIIGAKIAEADPPTPIPNTIWKVSSDDVRLATARLAPNTTAPISTTSLGPIRSDSAPQAMLPTAMARKPTVIAAETPVTDHPVALAIGNSITGSENIAPIATHPSSPRAATMIQR